MHIQSKYSWIKHIDFLILDTITFILCGYFSYFIKFHKLNLYEVDTYRIVLTVALLVNIILALTGNTYSGILRRRLMKELEISSRFTFYSIISTTLLLYLLKQGPGHSRQVFIVTFVLYFILSIVFREIYKNILKNTNINKKVNSNKLIIYCEEKDATTLIKSIKDTDTYNEYEILGVILSDNKKPTDDYKVLCKRNKLLDYVKTHNVNEILIGSDIKKLNADVIKEVIDLNIAIHIKIDSIFGYKPEKAYSSKIGILDTLAIGLHTFTYEQVAYQYLKRFIDIFFSIIGITLLCLLTIGIKIANIITKDNGPIFYTHTRIGLNGKPYKLYKFRSMSIDADKILVEMLKDPKYKKEWDEYQKFNDDPRITKVGKFLRKTSLDEFPQFINVLKGEMSLVGPRPLVPGELESHGGIKLYEQVKPGLTSWWAANGRSDVNYEDRLEYEYYYVRNMSLELDLKAIFKTAAQVILEKGSK